MDRHIPGCIKIRCRPNQWSRSHSDEPRRERSQFYAFGPITPTLKFAWQCPGILMRPGKLRQQRPGTPEPTCWLPHATWTIHWTCVLCQQLTNQAGIIDIPCLLPESNQDPRSYYFHVSVEHFYNRWNHGFCCWVWREIKTQGRWREA